MKNIKNVFIGFGKGAKTLAKSLANAGEEVLVIEQSNQMYGGTCINIACIPTKALKYSAETNSSFNDAIVKKDQLTGALRQKNFYNIDDEPTADVWTGKATFKSNHELSIEMLDGEVRQIQAERIFINTGALLNIPKIDGVETSHKIVDSTGIMALETLPKKLTIIGGGYIGLEFASMFNQFGSEVTVLDAGETFIPREDREVADLILADMQESGIKFAFNANANTIIDTDSGVDITYTIANEEKILSGDIILLATGRKANTADLGLENTNIVLNDRAAIEVDEFLKTTVDNVWAMGDVKGGLQFTYISLDDSRIVGGQLKGEDKYSTKQRVNVPYTVFINPPLGRIGITEEQAKADGKNIKIFTKMTNSVPRAKIIQDPRGIFKAIVDADTDLILGVSIYAQESHEMINLITMAMNHDIPYTALRDQIYTHPTMSEAFNELFE